MLRALRVPLSWKDLLKRTAAEAIAHNCLGLAAQLAYYFFLALFPALLFLVALMSFMHVDALLQAITSMLEHVAPAEALTLMQDQILKIAKDKHGGLLTLGMVGAIWSTSSGVNAIIDTLNQAYAIQESRPWWKVKLIALGLTVGLALFIVVSTTLVLFGPTLAEKVAAWFELGPAFEWAWKIVQWPLVLGLMSMAVAIVYYFAPDAEQEWIWITPGSILATVLWLLISLGFKLYVSKWASYNATYGTIAGIIILMTWFYMSGLAVLIGAELNSVIEHASPYGKDPGERVAGERKKIGSLARKDIEQRQPAGTARPAIAAVNCDADTDLLPARRQPNRPRASDWILSGLVLAETAALAYARLRRRF